VTKPRRDAGTGSITARPNGRWLIRVDAGADPLTGERRRTSKVIKGTKRDAERVRDQLTATTHRLGPDLTLGALLAEWRAAVTLAPGTVRNYNRAQALIPSHLLATKAADIGPSTLDRLYRSLLAEGEAIHNVIQLHGVLSSAYNQAEKWFDIRPPTRRATPPQRPKATRNTAGLRDFNPAPLLAAARSPLEELWLALHLTTGARRSEVLALRWSDIDLDTATVTIAEALDPVTRQRKGTKSGDFRRVPIDATTVEMVRRWRALAQERAMYVGIILNRDSYIISDELDCSTPWTPDAATKRYSRIAKRAGVTGVTLHGLRAAVGTWLIAAGVDPKTVQARLGHAQIATTMDIYVRSMPITDRAAADVIGNLVHR